MNQDESGYVVVVDPRVLDAVKSIAEKRAAIQEVADNIREAMETLAQFLGALQRGLRKR